MLSILSSAVYAGINFNTNIRGVLVVLVGISVLMGSVWLIISTNTGTRLGTLIALSGFFAWMTIMATVWWIFGIGWKGNDPSWKIVDIERNGDTGRSSLEIARKLPNDILPGQTPHQFVLSSGSQAAIKEYGSPIPADQVQGLSPADAAKKSADWELKNEIVTLSEVKAVDPDLVLRAIKDGTIQLGGWRLLSTAQSGEAVTSASNALVAEGVFSSTDQFKVLNSFDIGGGLRADTGSHLPPDPNRWDRIYTYIKESLRIKNPTRYAIVQVEQVKDKPTVLGEAPPRPEADPTKPVISVVMKRDLGNRRLRPAMVCIASLLLFSAFAYMLHLRDKQAMAARAALAKR